MPVHDQQSASKSKSDSPKKRLSVIMAHPDDAELLCFGSILYFVNQGYEANVLVVTDGENGTFLEHPHQETVMNGGRREESIAAFSRIGVTTTFLGLSDGHLSINIELVSKIESYLNEYKPEIVITHFAQFNAVEHHDHVAVGCAVVNAATRARSIKTVLQAQPLAAGLMPFVPNYFVKITPHIEAKVKAINEHQTQLANHPYMAERFHQCRASINAFSARRTLFESGELFESFFASLILMG
jgi:LmbE family N-acetylglucosaminyl deacetylase